MNSTSNTWRRVTRDRPCPVCGKGDWCLVAEDGETVICPRTEAGSVRKVGDAGWLHRLPVGGGPPLAPVRWRPPRLGRPLRKLMEFLQQETADPVPRLSTLLGVSVDSLRRLGIGWHPEGPYWAFPEKDGAGREIGIQRRYPDGTQRRMSGTKSGLTYAPDWDTKSGPAVLVEGASDVAALMDLGLTAVGRPSNRGGVPLLANLLQEFPEDRQIIVLGEHDEKADGRWPGKEGAIHTAKELAKRLERSIHWALPPDQAKDARAWLNRHSVVDPLALQEVFLEGLDLQQELPPPIHRPFRDRHPEAALGDHRSQMLARRLESLDRPGIYVDRGATGVGKSTVDLQVLRHLRDGREVNA